MHKKLMYSVVILNIHKEGGFYLGPQFNGVLSLEDLLKRVELFSTNLNRSVQKVGHWSIRNADYSTNKELNEGDSFQKFLALIGDKPGHITFDFPYPYTNRYEIFCTKVD
jgi:hypothetical protein